MNIVSVSPCAYGGSDGGSILMRNIFAVDASISYLSIHTITEESYVSHDSVVHYQSARRGTRNCLVNFRRYLSKSSDTLDGIFHFSPTENLKEMLDEFSPDVVYTQLGPPWLVRMSVWISRTYNAKLVIHVMDDYIPVWPVSGVASRNKLPFKKQLNRVMLNAFESALEQSSVRLCISQQMADEYERRYGYSFSSMSNPVELSKWSGSTPACDSPFDGFTVCFIGSLLEQTNLSAIYLFVDALRKLNLGFKVKFKVASQNATREFLDYMQIENDLVAVEIVENLDYAKVPAFLNDSDVALMPINFSEECVRFCAYSWPTKLSEYLASTTPVLYLGPGEIGFAKSLREKNLAYIIENEEHLNESLEKCFSEYAIWSVDVLRNSNEYATQSLSVIAARAKLTELMETSV